ncbi:MAG: helix-turn-helix domain-containing protein [Actinoallomurus sp.]
MTTTTPDKSALLTTRDVAGELRFGLTKTRALLRSGAIPSFMIGGHRRVARVDLDSYIETHRTQTATADRA